jgi:sulfoquinovosidase
MRASVFFLLTSCIGNRHEMVQGQTQAVITADPFSLQLKQDGVTVFEATRISAIVDQPRENPKLLPGWDSYEASESPPVRAEHGKLTRATQTEARARFEVGGVENTTLTVSVAEQRVQIDIEVNDRRYQKTALDLSAGSDEHFFGLGERFATVDHRGLSLYSWAEEGGLGAGENAMPARGSYPYPNGASMTYFPVPFVHSTAGYALFANTTWRTEMKLASVLPDQVSVVVHAPKLPLVIYTAAKPLERIARYTEETGRPMLPAPWVWGVRMRSSAADMRDGKPFYQRLRELRLPVTVFDDSMHFLPARAQAGREQALKDGAAVLHRWGYKITGYNTPYVAQGNPRNADDYAYGVDNALFQKTMAGNPATAVFVSGDLLTMSPIDLVNPDGAAWYRALLSRTLDLGYDGWMNDFGEYTAATSVMADGRTGAEVHNLYPVLSAMAAHALLEERKPNDYLFYVRSGYIGTQAFVPQVWGGDSEASFDDTQGLPSAVRAGLNLAMVGVSQYGSDVTGFKCITQDRRDKEIYVRWLQFGAVSPLFNEQNACANPVSPQTKWKLFNDEETQEAWRQNASFHTRLAPYLRAAALEANRSGTPIMRHPFLLFPHERDAWSVEDSYFFGPSLYAAPVVHRGETVRHLWLPPGRYVEWTERSVHTGPGFVNVPAPLMRLPLFLVENTLVPLLDTDVQTLAPASEPGVITEASRSGVLDVIAAVSRGGRAQMHLVDGTLITIERGDLGGSETAQFTSEVGRSGDIVATVEGGPARIVRFEVVRLP